MTDPTECKTQGFVVLRLDAGQTDKLRAVKNSADSTRIYYDDRYLMSLSIQDTTTPTVVFWR